MIKIQNIYYMLAYAFQVLHEDSYRKISIEEFDDVESLLAAILAKGIANQIKRGLGCEYISVEDSLRSPRGKLSISSSIKERTIQSKRLVCEYDELSENVYINQILKTTALLLIKHENVNLAQKKGIKKSHALLP